VARNLPLKSIRYTKQASEDLAFWIESGDITKIARLNRLIGAALENPSRGIGKPEKLRHEFEGCWSRRIDRIHRLVYFVDGNALVIVQMRYHY